MADGLIVCVNCCLEWACVRGVCVAAVMVWFVVVPAEVICAFAVCEHGCARGFGVLCMNDMI